MQVCERPPCCKAPQESGPREDGSGPQQYMSFWELSEARRGVGVGNQTNNNWDMKYTSDYKPVWE